MRAYHFGAIFFLASAGLAAQAPHGCGGSLDLPAPVGSTLDPTRSYEDRLRLFQLLKEAHPYPKGWKDHRDGFAIQTRWQADSGRSLHDSAGRLHFWWANINWNLLVWPVQILSQERGEFSDLAMVNFDGAMAHRFRIPKEVVAALLAYYDRLDWVRKRADAGLLWSWTKPLQERELQRLLWDFHYKAVAVGIERNRDMLPGLVRTYPTAEGRILVDQGEKRFAESWGTTVGILRALNFPTDLAIVSTINGQTLPHVWVREADYQIAKPSTLSLRQRMMLQGLWSLHRFEQRWGGLILRRLESLAWTPEKTAQALELFRKASWTGWSGFALWSALWGL